MTSSYLQKPLRSLAQAQAERGDAPVAEPVSRDTKVSQDTGPGSVYASPGGDDVVTKGFGDLDAELARIGWSEDMLMRATGRNRATVWRWRKSAEKVPPYAITIIEQQKRIKMLMDEVKRLSKPLRKPAP